MSTAQEMVALYIEAEKAVLDGKSVNFNGQTYTSEDLDKIRAGRKEWERRLFTNSKPHSLASWS